MLGNSQFYHRTIRKIVVAFGTVFNDIFYKDIMQMAQQKEKYLKCHYLMVQKKNILQESHQTLI